MKIKIVLIDIALLIAIVIGFVFVQHSNEEPKQNANFFRAAMSFNQIDRIMRPAIAKYDLNRILLFRIHSQNNSDMGTLPTFQISVANVQTREGVGASVNDISNLPAGMYSKILPHLLNHEYVFAIVRTMDSGPLKQLLEKRDNQAAAWFGVKDASGSLVGMLAVSWSKESDVPKGDRFDDMIDNLTKMADKLGTFFGLSSLSTN